MTQVLTNTSEAEEMQTNKTALAERLLGRWWRFCCLVEQEDKEACCDAWQGKCACPVGLVEAVASIPPPPPRVAGQSQITLDCKKEGGGNLSGMAGQVHK